VPVKSVRVRLYSASGDWSRCVRVALNYERG
jgi:hypothetical protein